MITSVDEVELYEPWQKAAYPIPLYHKTSPRHPRTKLKRAMRYRDEPEPRRLECPRCGAVCDGGTTMTLMLRISRL
jgi:hypothetical protein